VVSTRTDVTIERARPFDTWTLGPPLGSAREVLRALADPLRAAIIDLLSAEQLCTCHLQAALGAKQTLVSHHLRLLREAGLVLTEPCGRFTYYRLAPGAFDACGAALQRLSAAASSDLPRRPC
jgi:ArsR family transcriptional regulator, arsenate/arsenite/antimonite-responsive transcriptional repressor